MTEDVASVLEHFINDVANLPNEIAHIYEEIQAKDKLLLELQKGIQQRDGSIQKFIRANGSHIPYPKEEAYSNHIRKAYAQINIIQDEKVAFAQKALDLMDKHIKRLDVKIKDLQNEGLFPAEQIPLPPHPSITDSKIPRGLSHSRNASRRVSPSIHVRSSSLNLEKAALSAASTPTAANSANPLSAAVASGAALVGTPGSTSGHDNKRRRLTTATGASVGINLGTAISGATPSISSTLANAGATTPGPGSAGLSGRGSVENGRPTDGNGLPARTGPGIRRGGMKHGGVGHKRRVQHEQEDEEDEDEEDDEDDEENGDDKRLYCSCQQVSWGNMVACDDSDCRYEWFHWGCVNLTKEPPGKWYCKTCRERREKKREE